jgi:uncharacterized protein GlcG (DUF336 family)
VASHSIETKRARVDASDDKQVAAEVRGVRNSTVADAAIASFAAQEVGKESSQQTRKWTSLRRPSASPRAAESAAPTNLPATPVQTTLKASFPSVTEAPPARRAAEADTIDKEKLPTPAPATAPPATATGGGGSNATGGGPPASGPQGKASLASAASKSTATSKTTAAPAEPTSRSTSTPKAPTPPPAPIGKEAKLQTAAPPSAHVPQPAKPEPPPTATKVEMPQKPTKQTKQLVRKNTGTKPPAPMPTQQPPATPTTNPAPSKPPQPPTNPAPQPSRPTAPPIIVSSAEQLSPADVERLLDRASAATPRNDAIIAVVDRNGTILGVRVENGVMLSGETLYFAIDGAVAKARTAAFFSNDQAPLTSRTVRFISQTTITQREVESNPNLEPTSPFRGPGFVAPIGLGGHFPPGVRFTPQVDLFAIEHTNRDSVIHPGPNRIRDGLGGGSDDIDLSTRFSAPFDLGKEIPAPESYGMQSGLMPTAQSRGIGTLPGGMPIFRADAASPTGISLVGGIGVFFPGPDGYATYEQNFQHADGRNRPQTTDDRLNARLVLEAEYTAFVAADSGIVAGISPVEGVRLPRGRIDLVGITLEIYGPHPNGERGLVAFGKRLGTGTVNGTDQQVAPGGATLLAGTDVPEGWLVSPRAAADGRLSANEVRQIIERGIAEAQLTRAAIRLPLGERTRMVLSVSDKDGNILGLFRMPDATFFSIDVAVAKGRNVAYYADAADLQPEDQVPGVAAGVAFTNRAFRYLSTPFFPTGVDTAPSGPFSMLNDPNINPRTAENTGPPLPPDAYTSVVAFDSFNPGTNFHEGDDPGANIGNQNGVVFFPGSTPLYKNGVLVGGFGVSGDGVDQDDVVTFGGGGQFIPGPGSPIVRSDQVFVRGVRLPYQKFNRNPRG